MPKQELSSLRLSRLLMKAVRSLPSREQDAVLRELLAAVLGSAGSAQSGLSRLAQTQPVPAGFGETQLVLASQQNPTPPSASTALMMVPVRLSRSQYDRLKEWCATNNFAIAVVLRGLVDRFLEEQGARAS
jgi:hypothetical protein